MQPYLGDDHLAGYLTMPTPSPTTACHMQPYLGDDHLAGYLAMATLLQPLPVIYSPIWVMTIGRLPGHAHPFSNHCLSYAALFG
jgi:hypothetical protein